MIILSVATVSSRSKYVDLVGHATSNIDLTTCIDKGQYLKMSYTRSWHSISRSELKFLRIKFKSLYGMS